MKQRLEDYFDILISRIMIWLIKRGYNQCNEFEPKCPSCEAWKIVEWLEEHIQLIKFGL